jgi:hypothetical protein
MEPGQSPVKAFQRKPDPRTPKPIKKTRFGGQKLNQFVLSRIDVVSRRHGCLRTVPTFFFGKCMFTVRPHLIFFPVLKVQKFLAFSFRSTPYMNACSSISWRRPRHHAVAVAPEHHHLSSWP